MMELARAQIESILSLDINQRQTINLDKVVDSDQ
jgi:hypothetical protein